MIEIHSLFSFAVIFSSIPEYYYEGSPPRKLFLQYHFKSKVVKKEGGGEGNLNQTVTSKGKIPVSNKDPCTHTHVLICQLGHIIETESYGLPKEGQN